MSGDRQAEAKRLYLEEKWTMEAIAAHFGVSLRTIERWASDGAWTAQKKGGKVVSIESKPKPRRDEPGVVRSRRSPGELDELEIVEGAIASLAAALEGDGEGKIDARSMGGIAGGLVKLLEYRRKVQPQTAAEVVELAIGLGISPNEFIDQLEVAWQRRA